MKSILDRTTGSLAGAVNGVKEKAHDVAFTVERSAHNLKDGVAGATLGAVGAAVYTWNAVAGTVALVFDIGVVVAGIMAPVPVLIGAALLWLFEMQLKQSRKQVNDILDDDHDRRKMERVTSLLKKYGQIPESAVLETKVITITLNSRTGDVTGKVLAGPLKGTDINQLTLEQIEDMAANELDADTRKILEAFKSLRIEQAKHS